MVTPNSCPAWEVALTCACSGAVLAIVDTQVREPKSTTKWEGGEEKIGYRKLGWGVLYKLCLTPSQFITAF